MVVQKSLMMKKEVKTKSKSRVFEKIVTGAVEKVFSSFDESSKQAIYSHLEKRFDIRIEQIPRKIDAFADALEEMFGAGAKLIKIKIMKLAFSQVRTIKYSTNQNGLLFTDYMKNLSDS